MKIFNDVLISVENKDIFDGIVIIPNNIRVIGDGAFEGKKRLKIIVLPKNLKIIGKKAFKNCTGLKSINLPNTLEDIGAGAFLGATSLKKIKLPKKISKLNDEVFSYCTNLKHINFPQNLTEIGNSTFLNCESLKIVKLPDGVKSIGKSVFAKCENLQSVKLPQDLQEISDCLFIDCINLKNISLPKSIVSIGNGSFSGCNSLKSLKLPNSVNELGDKAFYECFKLSKIKFNDNLTHIGANAFKSCAVKNIVFPKSLLTIKDNAFQDCLKLESVIFPEKTSILGKDLFSLCNSLKYVELPKNINEIPDSIFVDCTSLTQISLPKNIKEIGNSAFYNCKNLSSICIPNNVKKIGISSFQDCISLKNVELPESLQEIETAGFLNCLSLNGIKLPSTLKTIGKYAFCSCSSLSNVEIPNEIQKIGEDAFCGCLLMNNLFIPSNIQFLGKIGNPNFKYFQKNDSGYNFFVTKPENLNNTLSLDDFNIRPEVLISRKKYYDQLFHEQKNPSVANFFKEFAFDLPEAQFDEFMESHNFTFFKSELSRYNFNSENFYKLIYNLGGVSKPVIENGKQIDYAQKVCGFLQERLRKKEASLGLFSNMASGMAIKGLNPEFTEFFISNFASLKKQETISSGFTSKCFNDFDYVQKTNTSNKGSQRQLKPTVEKFIDFYNSNKFSGVTGETRNISEEISKYFNRQETFDYAIDIFKEKKEKHTPDNILNIPLKETPFAKIDELTGKIQDLQTSTLSNLTKTANKQFTFEWLSKNDPKNLILGKLCSCCAHIEGFGYGIAHASVVDPNVQNMVIRDENGEIVAKSVIYINRDECYGICNTVAVSERIKEDKLHDIYLKFKQGIKAFADEYNKEHPNKKLKQINVGLGFNALHSEIRTNDGVSLLKLEPLDFSKFGPKTRSYNHGGDSYFEQSVIWSLEDEKNAIQEKNLEK